MAGVFISYRREDSPGHAGRIFDRLQARFGSDVVFMDVHAIDGGVDFVAAIERAVGSCGALLAIIGPEWMAAADEDGRRRLDDPRDFVRLEIGGALKRGIPVVPVLVDNARLPARDDLPDELEPLVRRNAVVLRDSRWDADFDELERSVERLILSDGQQASPTATRARPIRAETTRTSTRNWVWRSVAGMAVIAAGAAAAASRGCVPDPDEPKVAATSPAAAPTPESRAEPSPEAASSGLGQRPGNPRVAGDVTPEVRPRPARRGRLGIIWFGLWLDTITDNPRGVIVGEVAPGGPAALAGIDVDDVLIEIAGRPVASFADVSNAVGAHLNNEPADTPAMVHVVRDGKRLELPVVFDRQFVLRR